MRNGARGGHVLPSPAGRPRGGQRGASSLHRSCLEFARSYLDEIKTPGYHTIKLFREMSKGNIDFLWSAHNNWAQSLPNLTRFLGEDGEHTGIFDTFIAVNEVYPTLTTQYADVVFPVAMWVEREVNSAMRSAAPRCSKRLWSLWAMPSGTCGAARSRASRARRRND